MRQVPTALAGCPICGRQIAYSALSEDVRVNGALRLGGAYYNVTPWGMSIAPVHARCQKQATLLNRISATLAMLRYEAVSGAPRKFAIKRLQKVLLPIASKKKYCLGIDRLNEATIDSHVHNNHLPMGILLPHHHNA